MLLQSGPIDTVFEFTLGFAVIFGLMGLYLISLRVRQRNLEKDYELLKELESED
jgi:pilus assembly protein TadC